MSDLDEKFMRLALRLAARGKGTTSPNPRVGAVVVKGGIVVGKGWHRRPGEAHAEVFALDEAGSAAGSTLYVTLEPCSTWGRTPPCTDKIIASRVKRVVAGAVDPWPAHRGRGLRILRRSGVEVSSGILRAEAEKLNEGFNKYVATGLPFVTVKAAMGLDGKTATSTGESKWISNELSRREVHRMRRESDAIMVGIGTVKRDDPSLTVRLPGFKRHDGPRRVVVDSRASIDLNCRLLSGSAARRTIVAATRLAPAAKLQAIASTGAEIIVCRSVAMPACLPGAGRRSVGYDTDEACRGAAGRFPGVSLRDLMRKLAARGILYVLMEGGSTLITSALEAGIVDKIAFFYAPKLIGGFDAPSVFAGKGASRLKNALAVRNVSVRRFGSDILVEGYVAAKRRPR